MGLYSRTGLRKIGIFKYKNIEEKSDFVWFCPKICQDLARILLKKPSFLLGSQGCPNFPVLGQFFKNFPGQKFAGQALLKFPSFAKLGKKSANLATLDVSQMTALQCPS